MMCHAAEDSGAARSVGMDAGAPVLLVTRRAFSVNGGLKSQHGKVGADG